jgi:hypothetical protein
MLVATLVAVWFAVVAMYLVRQWWVSELAQRGDGVGHAEPAPLPAAPARDSSVPAFLVNLRVQGSAAR